MMNSLTITNGCLLAPLGHTKNSFVPAGILEELQQQEKTGFYPIESLKGDKALPAVAVTADDDTVSVSSLDEFPIDKDPTEETPQASEPFDFQTLEICEPNSWSIHVMDRDYQPHAMLSFRLVRNSEPNSALYLNGEEIFGAVDAVLEQAAAAAAADSNEAYNFNNSSKATFYVHYMRSGRCVHVTDKRDVRNLLKRTLYRSKFSRAGCGPLVRREWLDQAEHHTVLSLSSLHFPQSHYGGKTLKELRLEAAKQKTSSEGAVSGRLRAWPSFSATEVFSGSDDSSRESPTAIT